MSDDGSVDGSYLMIPTKIYFLPIQKLLEDEERFKEAFE